MANRHRSRLNRKERTNKKITLLLLGSNLQVIFLSHRHKANNKRQTTKNGTHPAPITLLNLLEGLSSLWNLEQLGKVQEVWRYSLQQLRVSVSRLLLPLLVSPSSLLGKKKFSKMKDGTKRSAGNCCPSCKNTNCFDIIQSAPAWGK